MDKVKTESIYKILSQTYPIFSEKEDDWSGGDSIAVDTHVHRVLNRTGIVETKTAEETAKIIVNDKNEVI